MFSTMGMLKRFYRAYQKRSVSLFRKTRKELVIQVGVNEQKPARPRTRIMATSKASQVVLLILVVVCMNACAVELTKRMSCWHQCYADYAPCFNTCSSTSLSCNNCVDGRNSCFNSCPSGKRSKIIFQDNSFDLY
ncbi:uncharacterized protein LOC114521647 [Dendronephthya gigantea]|uniref:uncharacterized protein LOC114521647 n=1 Tax=Dendronephthya gigantea TaxID=151771 RepID=UPI00106928D3|nr:uncharacterized protein LOC114521647 [Dendronephthya gigantea]